MLVFSVIYTFLFVSPEDRRAAAEEVRWDEVADEMTPYSDAELEEDTVEPVDPSKRGLVSEEGSFKNMVDGPRHSYGGISVTVRGEKGTISTGSTMVQEHLHGLLLRMDEVRTSIQKRIRGSKRRHRIGFESS